MDVMRAARRGRDGHRLRRAGQQFDPVGLVDGVQHEGAAGLALAVEAMAAVHEHGRIGQPITHLATGAAAFQGSVHGHLLPRVLIEARRDAGQGLRFANDAAAAKLVQVEGGTP